MGNDDKNRFEREREIFFDALEKVEEEPVQRKVALKLIHRPNRVLFRLDPRCVPFGS